MKFSAPRFHSVRRPWKCRCSGLSMTDLVITIAIIGILSGMAIASFSNVREGARRAIALEVINDLNQALAEHSQVQWSIELASDDASTDDEILILRSLQYRDATNPAHGSPYMNPGWNPEVSSSIEDHRVIWNGTAFELVAPGDAGLGLRVNFEGGGDMGDPVPFPVGFVPVGPGQS
ncbi:MAG: Tfp pilus assembly protein FimT/FimU [Verrucomicrobiales bacterium]